MHVRKSTIRAAFAAAALLLASAAPLAAQAGSYPAFQPPRVINREFNFGLADADGGTTLLFQWREGQGAKSQLSLDVGVMDTDGQNTDNVFLLGGQFAHQLTTARADMPFDLLLTVGANLAHADNFNVFRVPVGVSAGHRFPLEGGLALTPFVHPRLAFAHCGDCVDESNLGVEFDFGVDFEFSPAFSLRAAGLFGDDDTFTDDAFGISLAWRPGRR